jgi:DegV family protein with EDD domain
MICDSNYLEFKLFDGQTSVRGLGSMKQKVAVLTDSSSSIYNVKHNFENLFMIDIPVFLDDQVFTNFMKFNDQEFYHLISKTESIPKTSQPSVGETLSKYEYIKSLGYTHLIYLPISKELSGTYQSGMIAKDMIEGITIEVVDTKTSVSVLGSMALEACRLIRQGYEFEPVLERIEAIKGNASLYLVVNDLTYLVKNGRLSNAKSLVANLLKIKPVIKLTEEGKLVACDNIRTFRKALQTVVDQLSQQVEPNKGVIQIYYTNNVKDLHYAEKLVSEKFPEHQIEVHTLPATVVAHIGLEAIAYGYVNFENV